VHAIGTIQSVFDTIDARCKHEDWITNFFLGPAANKVLAFTGYTNTEVLPTEKEVAENKDIKASGCVF